MTIVEFFGCTFLAFGPAAAMFMFTIIPDPVRVIILVIAAFFWILSLFLSSFLWLVIVPLRESIILAVTVSVACQEIFRWLVYKTIRKTELGLQKISEHEKINQNKHIFAYVSGLGFGIISGAFGLANILADMIGPGTMGLEKGTEFFFVTSSAHILCIILLHIFWNVIFFHAFDLSKYYHIVFVTLSHLLISCLTLLNRNELYVVTLTLSYVVAFFIGMIAFHLAGGNYLSFQKLVRFK